MVLCRQLQVPVQAELLLTSMADAMTLLHIFHFDGASSPLP